MLAAASVVAVAAAAAVISAVLYASHQPAPRPQHADGLTGAASPPASTISPPVPTVRPSGPWGMTLLRPEPPDAQLMLIGSRGALYAVDAEPTGTEGGQRSELERIDPGTGRLAARAVLDDSGVQVSDPVIAAHALWMEVAGPADRVELRGFSLTTLTPVASIRVPVPKPGLPPQSVLAAGPDGSLYLAAPGSVVVADPVARSVTRRIPLAMNRTSQMPSIAISPDGTRLYAGIDINGNGGTYGQIQVRDPATGALLATVTRPGGGEGLSGLVATAGGVWGRTGSGMASWDFFAPASDLAHSMRAGGGGFGGLGGGISVSGGAVWLGGVNTISCADPVTGRTRASAALPGDHGDATSLGGVAYAGGRAFAQYLDPNSPAQEGLVRISPAASCTR